jgi:hypothetical protein
MNSCPRDNKLHTNSFCWGHCCFWNKKELKCERKIDSRVKTERKGERHDSKNK